MLPSSERCSLAGKHSRSFSVSALYAPFCVLHYSCILTAKECLQKSRCMLCLIQITVIRINDGFLNWHIELYICSGFKNLLLFPLGSNLCKSCRTSGSCSFIMCKLYPFQSCLGVNAVGPS